MKRTGDVIQDELHREFCPLGCYMVTDYVIREMKDSIAVASKGGSPRLQVWVDNSLGNDRVGAAMGLIRMLQKNDLDLHRLEGDL